MVAASSTRDRWDAIVVGGGPAGAVCAVSLALRGWDALLIDKGPRGRDTCCGHCLNHRVAPTLRSLGLLDRIEPLARARTRSLRIHLDNRRAIDTPIGDAGWVVPRTALDAALLDAAEEAGATILHSAGARVDSIADDHAAVRVHDGSGSRVVQTGLLIGADGLNSAVARSAGLTGARSAGAKYGFSLTFPASPEPSDGVVEMFTHRSGYVGLVREDHHVHLAALVSPRAGGQREPSAFLGAMRARFESLDGALPVAESAHAAIRRDLSAAGPMPWRPRRVSIGPVALVGDAAGYVEPFTGEGMSWAIQSASMLCEIASRSTPGRWSHAHSTAYQLAWSQRIAPAQRRCRAIARLLERPRLLRAAATIGAPARLASRVAGRISAPQAASA